MSVAVEINNDSKDTDLINWYSIRVMSGKEKSVEDNIKDDFLAHLNELLLVPDPVAEEDAVVVHGVLVRLLRLEVLQSPGLKFLEDRKSGWVHLKTC